MGRLHMEKVKMFPKAYMIAVICAVLVFAAACAEDTSEQDQYRQAQDLLDNWNGDRAVLRQADKLLQAILVQNPKSALAYVGFGRLTYLEGFIGRDNIDAEAMNKAHGFFIEAMRRNAALFDVYFYNGYAWVFQGDYGAARHMAQKCREIEGNSPRTDLLLAEIAVREKDYDRVLDLAGLINAELLNKKQQADLQAILARTYQARDYPTKAEEAYGRLLKLVPDSPWALIDYSAFLNDQGEVDQAIAYGEKALEKLNFDEGRQVLSRAYYRKARDLYWNKFQPDKARHYFQLTIERDPYNANAYYGLGLTYLEDGFYVNSIEAEDAFKKAILLNPYHHQAKRELERIRRQREERR